MVTHYLQIELSEEQSLDLEYWAQDFCWKPDEEGQGQVLVSYTVSPAGKIVLELAWDVKAAIERLRSEDEDVRCEAKESLLQISSSLEACSKDEIVALLRDEHSYVRLTAASILGEWSPLDESALETLVSLLGDESEEVQRESACALARHGAYLSADVLWSIIGFLRTHYASSAAQLVLDEIRCSLSTHLLESIAQRAQDETGEMKNLVAVFLTTIGHESLVSTYLSDIVDA